MWQHGRRRSCKIANVIDRRRMRSLFRSCTRKKLHISVEIDPCDYSRVSLICGMCQLTLVIHLPGSRLPRFITLHPPANKPQFTRQSSRFAHLSSHCTPRPLSAFTLHLAFFAVLMPHCFPGSLPLVVTMDSTGNPRPPSSSSRKKTNSWTFEQCLCLDVLWTHYRHLSDADRARIFGKIFEAHLATRGFEAGLTTNTIKSQYAMRLRTYGPSWTGTWARICSTSPDAQVSEMREQLKSKIQEALQGTESIEVAAPRTPSRQTQSHGERSTTRNPYATPGPSTRKRSITVVSARYDDSDDELDLLHSAKRTSRPSPTVVVPPSPEIVTTQTGTALTPRSAKKVTKYRSGGREGANMLYHRLHGAPILLFPHEFAEAQLPLETVSEDAAHPTPPALLFRY